ncbi:unnamed protein product [Orchesella dallaii]|uniref:Uncharacterized protein n=1 Tax=Orchesella dallaii TaxID=48710 RepID=A0ABP1QSG7_9HEXA
MNTFHLLLLFGVFLTKNSFLSQAEPLLISGTHIPPPETTDGKNETEKTKESSSKNESSSDNTILTDFQRIKLKDIRKFARLAGHEHPEVITDIDPTICYKDDCLEAAKEFFISMDMAQEPCNDWKKFACEWRTLSTKTAFDQHITLSFHVENQVKEILVAYNSDKTTVRNAQSYFAACEAWHQDFNIVDHITTYLETFGNWPFLTGKKEVSENWTKLMVGILKIVPENVIPYIIKVEPIAIDDESLTVLKIDSGFTNLDLDVEDIKFILEILRKKESPSSEKEIEQINEMKKCMKSLTSVGFDATEKPEVLPLAELQNKVAKAIPNSNLNIAKLIQGIFEGTDVVIEPEFKVLTNIVHLVEYIKAIESCNKVAVVNVLLLQLISLILGDTTNIINEKKMLHMENYNRQNLRLSERQCIEEAEEVFSYTLSEEYLKRHNKYEGTATEMLNDLVDNLKKGFTEVIRSIHWLGQEAKEIMFDKIANTEILMGYPTWVRNEEAVERYYKNLNFPSNGSSNQSQVYLLYRSTVLSWLNGKFSKMKLDNDLVDGWNYNTKAGFVGDTNVQYIWNLNQLRAPAGIIQAPFFSPDFPGYMNYGGLGSIIARELARLFDSDGILTNTEGETGLWLDDKSYKNYIDWTMRLQKDWNMNEINLKDKIASVLGYHITVKGYEEHLKSLKKAGKEETKLPGLSEIPPEKLLQIKYTNVANFKCTNLVKKTLLK